MIHGDVFRSPQSLNLFTALIGSGAQIFSTVLILLICVLIGVFKATKRGALLTAVILIYALCGIVGGIIAGRIFKQLKGKQWVWNVVLTASVFPLPLGVVFTWVNTIAWNRESTAALPFTTIVVSWDQSCVFSLLDVLYSIIESIKLKWYFLTCFLSFNFSWWWPYFCLYTSLLRLLVLLLVAISHQTSSHHVVRIRFPERYVLSKNGRLKFDCYFWF